MCLQFACAPCSNLALFCRGTNTEQFVLHAGAEAVGIVQADMHSIFCRGVETKHLVRTLVQNLSASLSLTVITYLIRHCLQGGGD